MENVSMTELPSWPGQGELSALLASAASATQEATRSTNPEKKGRAQGTRHRSFSSGHFNSRHLADF